MIKVYFDGACDNRSEAKYMGLGICAYKGSERLQAYDIALGAGAGTSNQAEYLALMEALKLAARLYINYPKEGIVLYGDSELIVKQITGEYDCSSKLLKPLLKQAKDLWRKAYSVKDVIWIPRIQNKEADVLSKLGLLKNTMV